MAGSHGRANKRRKGANGKRAREEPAEQQQGTAGQDQQLQPELVSTFSIGDQTPVPAAVVQVIGSYLGRQDFASARLACKCWSVHITEATTSVTSLISMPALVKVQAMAKLFPLANRVTLLIGSRFSTETLATIRPSMERFLRLEHLTLCNITPCESVITGTDLNSRRNTILRRLAAMNCSLSSLKLKNWPFPEAGSVEMLGFLPKLTQLVLDSEGLGTKPGSVSGFKSGALYRPRPKDVQALSELTRLQSLVIRCDQEPPAASELASLSKLVKLTSLDLGTWTVGKANLQAITHLTSLRELRIKVDNDSTPKDASLHNLRKLQQLHLTVPGVQSLAEELPYIFNHFSASLRGFSVGMLPATAWEALSPLLASSRVQDVSLSLHSSITKLEGLGQVSGLYSLALTKGRSTCGDLPTVLSSVFGLNASSLQRLSLEGWTSNELQPSTLQQLSCLTNLRELTVQGGDQTPSMLQVDLGALPTSLEFLSLKYAYLPCPVFHARMRKLQTLALRHCYLACFSHFQTAVDGLSSLRSLDLDDIPGLTDKHLEQLSSLTQLTSLGVGAIGNQNVTNLPVASLKPLKGLLRLRWCAGDMLDTMMDPLHLQHFTKLCVLCISTSLYWRMSRWGATNSLPSLACDIETVGA